MSKMIFFGPGEQAREVVAAGASDRKRTHHILHRDEEGFANFNAPLQAMVVTMLAGTFVIPHRFDRTQCFVVTLGTLGFLVLNESGADILEKKVMDVGDVVYIPPDTGFHTWVCLDERAAMVEVLNGPFDERARHDIPFFKRMNTSRQAEMLKHWESLLSYHRA